MSAYRRFSGKPARSARRCARRRSVIEIRKGKLVCLRTSSPRGEKLQPVPHLFGRTTADQPHDPSQLFTNGKLLLRRNDDARVSTFQAHPALVQDAVIGRVIAEQGSSGRRRGHQLFFILTIDPCPPQRPSAIEI